MFKNYFSTALNNLIKNRLYSAINIIGLAIGLAACIVMALYVQDENSYDKYWNDSERIYRANYTFDIPDAGRFQLVDTPYPLAPAFKEFFSNELEFATRLHSFDYTINIDDTEFNSPIVRVDPDFLNMFHLDILAGSIETTLENTSNIALSKQVAELYYGNKDPLGKVFTATLGSTSRDYRVTAVFDYPSKTVLDAQLITLLNDEDMPPSVFTWLSANSRTYFKFKEDVNIEALNAQFGSFIDQNIDISQVIPDPSITASDVMYLGLQKIEEAYLDSPWDAYSAGGNKTVVLAFSIIAALVLLIGAINFTILTTAKATQRSKEVAMRKVLGAKRKQLIMQFLGESFFIVFLSMVLSLAVVELMLPIFESIVGKELVINYGSPLTSLSLLTLLIIVGISGGLYPAFILSNFLPGTTLKSNRSTETRGSAFLRNALVIFQFSVSIILMIATCVIYVQLQHSLNRDPGFNREQLLVINNLNRLQEQRDKVNPLKQELLKLANISDVAFSSVQPSELEQNYEVYTKLGEASNSYTIVKTEIGYDYLETYQIPIISGRNYQQDRDLLGPVFPPGAPDITPEEVSERNLVINESAVRALGFNSPEEAIGKMIVRGGANVHHTIIGVTADNHIASINALPRAETYLLSDYRPDVLTLRFQGSPQAILEQVNNIWTQVMGDTEISTVFVDQLLAEEFEQEQIEARILISFSLLAILIACLGLFGSASFTVDRRTKEIGLRKVMGAKVKNIVALLIWQFSKPVLIANLIAWPIAIWAMTSWLERFPYQISAWLLLPLCLIAGLIALSIASLTVASNTTRVARSNPINALRYE